MSYIAAAVRNAGLARPTGSPGESPRHRGEVARRRDVQRTTTSSGTVRWFCVSRGAWGTPSGTWRNWSGTAGGSCPPSPIDQEAEPGSMTSDDERRREGHPLTSGSFVRRRLGGIGVAVLDVRLSWRGDRSRSWSAALLSAVPGRWVIRQVVQQLKQLAREYAASAWGSWIPAGHRAGNGKGRGDGREASETATAARRQAVGA